MNLWARAYEALHSSFIDALNECYPGVSPELGLPRQTQGWAPPAPPGNRGMISITRLLAMQGNRAAPDLAMTGVVGNAGLDPRVWPRVEELFLAEFTRRVGPNGPRIAFVPAADGKLEGQCARAVWTPIRMMDTPSSALQLFFGLGVLTNQHLPPLKPSVIPNS